MFNFFNIGDMQYFSGIMLLISGGSFLNVSTMHILPEALSLDHSHSLKLSDVVMLIGSMYLPILLTAGVRLLQLIYRVVIDFRV